MSTLRRRGRACPSNLCVPLEQPRDLTRCGSSLYTTALWRVNRTVKYPCFGPRQSPYDDHTSGEGIVGHYTDRLIMHERDNLSMILGN